MKKDKGYRDALKNITLITQIGFSIITPILIGVYIGKTIDDWIGTKGVFMIIFILLGTGGGFLNLLKITGVWNGKRK
ncbi:AtpZ/AtpI family protein [Wansuia hejianensis]|uniref:AtpZ/AtpI family protein n=1 Tax=Wansuia hejianensis TaxID=2763667 RepID=A0A926EYY2_9FIRM|nr:AtpZ/AtpI family protein [Wansuia hejianensis]MBC8590087.1 AtpZ/AtpI family protein [Wansuia hejianensis]